MLTSCFIRKIILITIIIYIIFFLYIFYNMISAEYILYKVKKLFFKCLLWHQQKEKRKVCSCHQRLFYCLPVSLNTNTVDPYVNY